MKNFKFISIKLAEDNGSIGPVIPKIMDIQIFKAGVFSYYEPGDMVMSKEMFQSMVLNFQNKVRGTDIAVDYGHCSNGEAAGWFKELYLNDEGSELWGKVEWTGEAMEKIADKQYRYISGEFSNEYIDEVGIKRGPTLWGAALTNRPFLKEMEPVIEMSEKEKIRMNEEVKKLSEELSQAKIQLSEKDAEIAKLKNEIVESERKAHEEKKTLCFNEMLKVGKVIEAQREAYMANDVVKFSELAMPINLVANGSPNEKNPSSIEMSKDEAEAKVLELAEEKLKAGITFREAITATLKENPELAKRYR